MQIGDGFPATFPALDAIIAGVDVARGAPKIVDVLILINGCLPPHFADVENDGTFCRKADEEVEKILHGCRARRRD